MKTPLPLMFTFNELAAAQQAALLMRALGPQQEGIEGVDYPKLVRLLYLADRQKLIDTGTPMTDSVLYNTQLGPIPMDVYDCIKGAPYNHAVWGKYFKRDGWDLVLTGEDPGDGYLCEYDKETLVSLATKHRDPEDLLTSVFELPEWDEPEDGVAEWLPYESVLRATGSSEEDILAFQKRNEALLVMDRTTKRQTRY